LGLDGGAVLDRIETSAVAGVEGIDRIEKLALLSHRDWEIFWELGIYNFVYLVSHADDAMANNSYVIRVSYGCWRY
jgi:hypothetical protein